MNPLPSVETDLDLSLLGALFSKLPDLLLIVDPQGDVLFTSPALRQALGYGPDALAGMSVANLVHRDDQLPVLARIAGALAGERADALGIRVRRADRRWLGFEVRGFARLRHRGLDGVVLVFSPGT